MCLDVYKHSFSSEMPATHVSSGPADEWHLGSRKFAAPAVAEQREKGKVLAGEWGEGLEWGGWRAVRGSDVHVSLGVSKPSLDLDPWVSLSSFLVPLRRVRMSHVSECEGRSLGDLMACSSCFLELLHSFIPYWFLKQLLCAKLWEHNRD